MTSVNRNKVNKYYLLCLGKGSHIYAMVNLHFPKESLKLMKATLDQEWSKENEEEEQGRKTQVFGILKRGRKVYTEIVPDCTRNTLVKDHKR